MYQGWEPVPDEEAIRYLEGMSQVQLFPLGAWIQIGIAERQTNDLVGDVGVCVSADAREAEIGFTLAREAQGSGLGTEAVRELVGLIFDHTDAGRVIAITDERNTRAHRLLLRIGFRTVETTHGRFRGEPCVEHVWELSRARSSSAPPIQSER